MDQLEIRQGTWMRSRYWCRTLEFEEYKVKRKNADAKE